jgi:hypothetical protein
MAGSPPLTMPLNIVILSVSVADTARTLPVCTSFYDVMAAKSSRPRLLIQYLE